MMIDILIVKPDNPYEFMREWLTKRRELYNDTVSSPTVPVDGKKYQQKLWVMIRINVEYTSSWNF